MQRVHCWRSSDDVMQCLDAEPGCRETDKYSRHSDVGSTRLGTSLTAAGNVLWVISETNGWTISMGHSGWCSCPSWLPHCRILSPDKTEWRLISATLCGWGRCLVAEQLWLMKCIREEEDCVQYRECLCVLMLCLCCVSHWHAVSSASSLAVWWAEQCSTAPSTSSCMYPTVS